MVDEEKNILIENTEEKEEPAFAEEKEQEEPEPSEQEEPSGEPVPEKSEEPAEEEPAPAVSKEYFTAEDRKALQEQLNKEEKPEKKYAQTINARTKNAEKKRLRWSFFPSFFM